MNVSSDIRLLEERGFNAWPARRTVFHGGWIFRLSDGLTKRANSVNALDGTPLTDGIRQAAEACFRRHGLPPIFRLSPLAPGSADRMLADAGYDACDPSLVLLAPAADTMRHVDIEIADAPSGAWLEGFALANGIDPANRATHDAIVGSIALPAAFATRFDHGEPIGFGFAVVERGMVGLFDIVVTPAHRGLGHGRTLASALVAWGCSAGADTAYLQVREANAPARRLYAGLGFCERYRYHYRVPAGPADAGCRSSGRSVAP